MGETMNRNVSQIWYNTVLKQAYIISLSVGICKRAGVSSSFFLNGLWLFSVDSLQVGLELVLADFKVDHLNGRNQWNVLDISQLKIKELQQQQLGEAKMIKF